MSALRACFAARGGEGVELAVQACAHDRRHFGLPGTGRLAIGLYAAHLALFLRWYPREQLLALRCEDEGKDDAARRAHVGRVFAHLGLEPPSEAGWAAILGSGGGGGGGGGGRPARGGGGPSNTFKF